MKNDFSGFVGRQNEIEFIANLISKKNETYMCLISGEGGVGKTWLLREVISLQNSFQKEIDSRLEIAQLIDLANLETLIPLTFEHLVCNEIGIQFFQKSNSMRDDYIRMQLADVSPVTVEQHLQLSYETFLQEYNSVSKNIRLVILVDTVDANVVNTDAFQHFILQIAPRLNNTVVIFAGRECATLFKKLNNSSVNNSELIQLVGFSREEAHLFFDETQSGKAITSDLRDKIHFLSKGKPILIGLAVTWLDRDMPIPKIGDMPLSQLQSLSLSELETLRREFEEALVRQIGGLGEDIHLVILEMAHLEKRFDAEILQFLHGNNGANIAILEQLSILFFVKHRPGDIHLLHDEMRELVKRCVWKYVDPLGSQRKDLSKRIASYYSTKISGINSQITNLVEDLNLTDANNKVLANLNRSRLERFKWLISVEKLFYEIGADADNGVKYFIQEFDFSTSKYIRNYSDMLAREITPFINTLTRDGRYSVSYRLANYFREIGNIEKARSILNDLWDEFYDDVNYKVGILQSLASCDRESALYKESLEKLQQALDLSKMNNLTNIEARIENIIGMTLVSVARFDDAIDHYQIAVEKAKNTKQTLLRATIMNNLSYALSLKGDHENALLYCESALEIRRSLERTRDVAMSFATLGSIHRDKGNFEQAYQHYQEALSIFESNDDKVWISTIRMERGIARAQHYEEIWYDSARANDLHSTSLMHLLENAETDLKISIEYGKLYNRKEMSKAVHELGHVYWEMGDLDKAEATWRESLLLAQESHNVRYAMENLIGFAELDYDRKHYDIIPDHFDNLSVYDNNETRKDLEFLWGRIAIVQGHALFDQGRHQDALPYYTDAYWLLAKHGGWGRYRLSIELLRLAKKIDNLNADTALEWCALLKEKWGDQSNLSKGQQSLMLFLETREIKAEQRR